jgi:multidrug efflux system membrane fusion protein
MAGRERATILSWIRRTTAEAAGASDAQLLGRFVADRDEAAFELLLWRHARLVFEVCLRVLHDPHDAEDAFQATFLALARRAGRIAKREAIAAWLHKVAYRVALTAVRRRDALKKLSGAPEPPSPLPAGEALPETRELRRILDLEIGRLPERFRAAVVLCYLEDKSVDQAAVLLGCPRGTVASRLARARKRLRVAARGLAVPAVLTAVGRANASGPFNLIPTVTAAAIGYASGGAAPGDTLPLRITALTEEVLRAMFLHKLKTGLVVLMAFLGIFLAGGGLIGSWRATAGPEPAAEPPRTAEAPKPPPTAKEDAAKDKPAAGAAPVVTFIRPKRAQFTPSEDFTGRLDARRSVEVRPAVGGFVQKVNFKAGDDVKKGDLLFELDPKAFQLALDKAEIELEAALAKKKLSETELQRARDRAAAQRATVDEFDNATGRVIAAEAGVKTARLEVARCRLELEGTKVTAPMAGQVGRPLVDAGALVFRGQDSATLLTTVTSLDPIGLTFEMNQNSFLNYQRLLREHKVEGPGGRLRMAVADERDPREGTLESFEDHVTPEGIVRVRGSFPNPDRLLLPGMGARVRVTFGAPRPGLAVPAEAIRQDGGTPYILVVNDRNVTERRTVTAGGFENGMYIIKSGLDEKDRVVIGGLRGGRAGVLVEPQEKKAEPQR